MAIVKMVGQADGAEIIFRLNDERDWIATIPKDLDGEYVVEIKAYDEAGNQAYASSMLFIVDPATLEVQVIPINYAYKTLEHEDFNNKTVISEFVYHEVRNSFEFKEQPQNFAAKVVS